jgi:two-component system chemotaxis response regulator CheY
MPTFAGCHGTVTHDLIGEGELSHSEVPLPRCARVIIGAEMSALRILIVDDSEVTRRILHVIVRSRQWTVCGEAENGWMGVKKFNDLKPDLVLLDLALPDIDGIEAARWMSASDPTVPIIMFTILNLDGLEKAARNAGICAVVSKGECWNLVKIIEIAVTRPQQLIQ